MYSLVRQYQVLSKNNKSTIDRPREIRLRQWHKGRHMNLPKKGSQTMFCKQVEVKWRLSQEGSGQWNGGKMQGKTIGIGRYSGDSLETQYNRNFLESKKLTLVNTPSYKGYKSELVFLWPGKAFNSSTGLHFVCVVGQGGPVEIPFFFYSDTHLMLPYSTEKLFRRYCHFLFFYFLCILHSCML